MKKKTALFSLLFASIVLIAGLLWFFTFAPAPNTNDSAGQSVAALIVTQSNALTGHEGKIWNDLHPSWFDNEQIIFSSNRNGHYELWQVRITQLVPWPVGASRETDNTMLSFFSPARDRYQPRVSPSGKFLAFGENNSINILGLDQKIERRLPVNWVASDPIWGDDDNSLFFTAFHEEKYGIHHLDLNSSRVSPVIVENAADAGAPTLAPDGKTIAFTSVAAGEPAKISIYDGDRSTITRIERRASAEIHPAWSPDGSMLAYIAIDPAGNSDLWVMSKDGSVRNQLTFSPDSEYSPAWSPDGQHLVCQVNDSNRSVLWLYTLGYVSYNN